MFVITLFRLLRSRHHHVVMDIQKWLAHADLDRAPDEPQGRRIQSREKNNVVTSPSPDHASHSRQSLASHASEIGPYSKRRARRHSPASQESTIFSASSSVSSTIWPPSSELYKRRKRHKTRENLYEPYSGVRKNRSGRRRGDDGRKRKKAGKSKTKHRRTEKPSKPSKPGQKLLEDFNAPNVGSSRLILHSPKKQAFFAHGKASSPQRTRGLPDLSFSEMRFLSRPIEPVTYADNHQADRSKKRQKERAQQDEAISTFFSGKRAPLAERDSNIQAAARSRGEDKRHHSCKGPAWREDRATSERSPSRESRPLRSAEVRPRFGTQISWSEPDRGLQDDLHNKARLAPQHDDHGMGGNEKVDHAEQPQEKGSQAHVLGAVNSCNRATHADEPQRSVRAEVAAKSKPPSEAKRNQAAGETIERNIVTNEQRKVFQEGPAPAQHPPQKKPTSSPFSKLLHVCEHAMAQQTPRREDQQPLPRPAIYQQPERKSSPPGSHQPWRRRTDCIGIYPAPIEEPNYPADILDERGGQAYPQKPLSKLQRSASYHYGHAMDIHGEHPARAQDMQYRVEYEANSNLGAYYTANDPRLRRRNALNHVQGNPHEPAYYAGLAQQEGLLDQHHHLPYAANPGRQYWRPFGSGSLHLSSRHDDTPYHQAEWADMNEPYEDEYTMHGALDIGHSANTCHEYEDHSTHHQLDNGWTTEARLNEVGDLFPARVARAAEEEAPGSRVVPAGFWRANRLY